MSGRGAVREVIAATPDDTQTAELPPSGANALEPVIHAMAFVERAEPAWVRDSNLVDVKHGLLVWFSRDRFVAIRADGFLAESLQRWLDRSPRPMFRRIPAEIFEGEVFAGEVKNLWLRGVHPRRRTMADTKYLGGPKLQDALSPLTDSSFALGAGRAEFALDSSQPDDRQAVGCAPSKSTFWVKQCTDFSEFAQLVSSILGLVARAVDRGPAASPLPWLATRQPDLTGVERAYAVIASSADDVSRGSGVSDGLQAAAEVLEDAELYVRPAGPCTADFLVDVGLRGRTGGTLKCCVSILNGNLRLAFGFHGDPADLTIVRPVLDALEHTELLTVYYESGHALTGDAVWASSLAQAAFPGWEWRDFRGYDVATEKPTSGPEGGTHTRLGVPGDRSLFAWAAKTFSTGYLTCDDGSGEVADFVHLDHDDALSLIHIKAAATASANRKIAVQRFEVVVGQAVKNLGYLDTPALTGALERTRPSRPACWFDGVRLPDRSEMLELLPLRSARAARRVIVIQPHVSRAAYEEAWGKGSMSARLLDTLLNSARGSVTGVGAEFQVWGADTR